MNENKQTLQGVVPYLGPAWFPINGSRSNLPDPLHQLLLFHRNNL